jgi:Spy/CpxP family protein refolding chaperone
MLPKTIIVAFFLLLGSSFGWAQQGKDVKHSHEKAHERIQMIKMWKLTEALKLDREESAKFFAVSNHYEDTKKKLRRDQLEDIQKLRHLLRERHLPEKEMRDLVSRIRTINRSYRELRVKQEDEELNLLKPEQQARYLLFQVDFRQEMESMIREIKDERPPRSGVERGSEKVRLR